MSIIGRRTHVVGFPETQGTIVGTYGSDTATVEWDDVFAGVCRVSVSNLVVLGETEMVDSEPETSDGGC